MAIYMISEEKQPAIMTKSLLAFWLLLAMATIATQPVKATCNFEACLMNDCEDPPGPTLNCYDCCTAGIVAMAIAQE